MWQGVARRVGVALGSVVGGGVLCAMSGWRGGRWRLGLACHFEAAWRVGGVLACHVGSVRWVGGGGAGWRWFAFFRLKVLHAVLGRRGGLAMVGCRGRMEVARGWQWPATLKPWGWSAWNNVVVAIAAPSLLRSPGSFHETGLGSVRPFDVYHPRDASLLAGKGLGSQAGRLLSEGASSFKDKERKWAILLRRLRQGFYTVDYMLIYSLTGSCQHYEDYASVCQQTRVETENSTVESQHIRGLH
ncbi:hypothetical protein EDB86DRAFT_2829394 [Lactarius hatsudake]|nr:hypothetical protein EDB86DRAFT_2829394 [Lactarius hatsudake]